ncbi:MAG TPA: hypothetical protein VGK10_15855 [Prolixibacteraceae bacterium]|jgi:hypothetical protein
MESLPKSHCSLTYDEVITKAQFIQPHFAADLAQFTAHDPWYTSRVNVELLSGIYLGLKDFSENSIHADIKRLKNLVSLKLADARHCYEKLKYYVDQSFQDRTHAHEIFGFEDFENARSSAKKMIPLLNKAHEVLLQEENEARLLDAYMPPGLTIDLINIAAELNAEYNELRILKKQHLLILRERIEMFNNLWDTLAKICEDAKIIFANDSARLAIYSLYDIEDLDTEQLEELEHK